MNKKTLGIYFQCYYYYEPRMTNDFILSYKQFEFIIEFKLFLLQIIYRGARVYVCFKVFTISFFVQNVLYFI